MKSKSFIAAIAISVFLFSLVARMQVVQVTKAQSSGSIFINSDGSVTGTNNIQHSGDTYTLVGNLSHGIEAQTSNVVIVGGGYTIDGNGGNGVDLSNGIGQDPTRSTISNVTIENLRIVNCGYGIQTNGGGNYTFYGLYITKCSYTCIQLSGCSNNKITYCTIGSSNESAISMNYKANYNIITENNLSGGVSVWLSGYETIDKNYWNDYQTKYPNATEIDNTGIGNTPYVFSAVQNGSGTIYYQDNHPLMKPLTIL